jgi:hypothetical protein
MLCNKAFRDVYVGILEGEMLQWAGSVDRMANTRSVYKRVLWEQWRSEVFMVSGDDC